MDVNRRVALVTGSGRRRVGNTVALTLAAKGYALAVHYHRSAGAAAETVNQIQSHETEAVAIQADLTIEADVDRLVQQVIERFGRIDVLVNTAAVWFPKRLEQVTAADVRYHFEVNTLGTFLCSQKVGLHMAGRLEGGSIITIGDWAIERPYRDYAAYFPSKGAIPAMTRSLAVEFGTRNPNVRVNCILPGPVMLPLPMPKEERDSMINATLLKREGRPDHIAQGVMFLIENDFVTGVCLPIDGGRTIYAGP